MEMRVKQVLTARLLIGLPSGHKSWAKLILILRFRCVISSVMSSLGQRVTWCHHGTEA